MPDRSRSEVAFAAAQRVLPGGVDSPVRAFKAVGGEPPVIDRGEGAYLVDLDGNRYVDYVCAYGPLILGHAPAAVVMALESAARKGTAFGAPTELETALAERVVAVVPSIERVRFMSSGTEATMTAIRLARGYTGRNKVLKFVGCYHGHSDGLLAKAGSGVATLALPDSAGVPASYAAETLVAPFNDVDAVRQVVERHGDDLAAIIVEPVAANMGVIAPAEGYLQALRTLTSEAGALLIFDEVISGFRVARGGAQALYGVMPDLTCLGKVIGGGAAGGRVGRAGIDHGVLGTFGTGVSGRHVVRESAGDDRRHCDAGCAGRAGLLRVARRARGASGRGSAGRGRPGGDSVRRVAGGIDPDRVLP